MRLGFTALRGSNPRSSASDLGFLFNVRSSRARQDARFDGMRAQNVHMPTSGTSSRVLSGCRRHPGRDPAAGCVRLLLNVLGKRVSTLDRTGAAQTGGLVGSLPPGMSHSQAMDRVTKLNGTEPPWARSSGA
jgi:hypothetical protein